MKTDGATICEFYIEREPIEDRFGSWAAVAVTSAARPLYLSKLPAYADAKVGSPGTRRCENADVGYDHRSESRRGIDGGLCARS